MALIRTFHRFGGQLLLCDLSNAMKEGELLDPTRPETQLLPIPEVAAAVANSTLDMQEARPSLDVFMLGLMLYEGLTGRQVFEGLSPKDISKLLLKPGELELDLSAIKENIARYILRNVLRKDPAQRFTIKDVILNLMQMRGNWPVGRRD
mmetsp:Transcript_24755/g.38871  ORF Transcript_24755/g.38871 Transcript_24755/m.38871 type:complete len:150 (+) Transcript_24755:2-451(+)